MIGVIMLLGWRPRILFLLVDYAQQLIDRRSWIAPARSNQGRQNATAADSDDDDGADRRNLAGALGLNEASRQRTSMGIAIIGGLISSTFLP